MYILLVAALQTPILFFCFSLELKAILTAWKAIIKRSWIGRICEKTLARRSLRTTKHQSHGQQDSLYNISSASQINDKTARAFLLNEELL